MFFSEMCNKQFYLPCPVHVMPPLIAVKILGNSCLVLVLHLANQPQLLKQVLTIEAWWLAIAWRG